jgi:anti-anti-sigma factor
MSEIKKSGNIASVKLENDIVASDVESLKTELKQLLEDGITDLTLDFSKVEMMDSMGIGILIATHNSLKKVDSQLKLINTSADILNLLKTMRLHEHFSMES